MDTTDTTLKRADQPKLDHYVPKCLKGPVLPDAPRFIAILVQNGFGSVTVSEVHSLTRDFERPSPFHDAFRGLVELIRVAGHVLMACGLFLLLALPAIGLDIFLQIYRTSAYQNARLVSWLDCAKYGWLIIDMALVSVILANACWKYLRTLQWR